MDDGGRALRFYTESELEAFPPPTPLYGEIISTDSLIVWFGPSGHGKSFLALDGALSLASGVPSVCAPAVQGPVCYVAAEGVGGVSLRVRAWKQYHGVAGDQGAVFLTHAVNLLHDDEVTAFIQALQALPVPPVVCVFDTLARCLVGGDENSACDMGIAIASLERVRTEIGCTVLVIHHTGKADADVERGSSSLRGAADLMVSITKDGDAVTLRCVKPKNSAPFEDVALRLDPVPLPDGASSCVLVRGEPLPGTLAGHRLTVLRVLAAAGVDGLASSKWEAVAEAHGVKRSFYDHKGSLERDGYVLRDGLPIGADSGPAPRGAKFTVSAAGNAALQRVGAGRGCTDESHQASTQSASVQMSADGCMHQRPIEGAGVQHPFRGCTYCTDGSERTLEAEAAELFGAAVVKGPRSGSAR